MDHDHDDNVESQNRDVNDAHDLPDPNGPVAPVVNQGAPRFSLRQLLAGVGLSCVGLGLILPALQSCTCAGATRSSRLKWQEQQDIINQAISEQNGDVQSDQLNKKQE